MIDPLQLEFLKQFINDQAQSLGKNVEDLQEFIIHFCVNAH